MESFKSCQLQLLSEGSSTTKSSSSSSWTLSSIIFTMISWWMSAASIATVLLNTSTTVLLEALMAMDHYNFDIINLIFTQLFHLCHFEWWLSLGRPSALHYHHKIWRQEEIRNKEPWCQHPEAVVICTGHLPATVQWTAGQDQLLVILKFRMMMVMKVSLYLGNSQLQ